MRKEAAQMPKYKETYPDNMERLCAMFPDREMLTITDVARFTGWSRDKVVKTLPIKKGFGISKASLAPLISV